MKTVILYVVVYQTGEKKYVPSLIGDCEELSIANKALETFCPDKTFNFGHDGRVGNYYLFDIDSPPLDIYNLPIKLKNKEIIF